MIGRLDGRLGHWLLLAALWAVTCLSGLGGPSLWDIDEGHNVEAGREMMESGNWIVPTFNFLLRVDKPALLYWLQISAFQCERCRTIFAGILVFRRRPGRGNAAWKTRSKP